MRQQHKDIATVPLESQNKGVKLFSSKIFYKGFEIVLKCFESYKEGETNTASFYFY